MKMAEKTNMKFNSVERRNLDRENQVLVESKKRKQKMAEDEYRKNVKEGQSTWDKALRQDQERQIQSQLLTSSLGGKQILQMKEKLLVKAQERLESKKDLEMLLHLDELHAQELRRQEEEKLKLKKIEHKNCLEDISRKKSFREEEAERLRTEEEKTKLVRFAMEEKLLQRKTEEVARVTRHRSSSQTVCDKLASLQKEQGAARAERDEQSLVKGLAKRQAEQEKRQKEKARKTAEALQSISAHRQKMIQERQQREEAERQSNAAWLQSQIEADRLFNEGNKLKAQKTRKEKVQLQSFNDSLEAEKLRGQQALTRKDGEAARNPLGGGLSFSCDEGSNYLSADTIIPLPRYSKANRKQQRDCKKLGKITMSIPDFYAMPEENEAVDRNDKEIQLDKVKVFTQGHKDMVQLCPTPPLAELTNSKRCSKVGKLISFPEAAPVNNSVERSHLDRENQVLAELRIKKQKKAEDEYRKNVKEGQSTWDKALRQDQERRIQSQLLTSSLGGKQILQMKEKLLVKAQERLESKKDLEMLLHLDELHAQELRRQEEEKLKLKKIEHKNCLEDISRKKSFREEEVERLRTEEEKTKLAHFVMEEKLRQRKTEEVARVTRHRSSSQTVCDKLASLQKEQGAARAERDEQSLVKGLAKRQAEQEKRQKEKARKTAEALQSISAHRQKMIQERQQREEAERQSNAAWLQSQIEADRLFNEGNKVKAQKTRKEKVQLQSFNDSLEAEKLRGQQALTRKDGGVARNPLGGGLSFSCDEGSNYLSADTVTPLPRYSKANRKQQREVKREPMAEIGQINRSSSFIKLPPIPNKHKPSRNIFSSLISLKA